jgi:hypothetical protein
MTATVFLTPSLSTLRINLPMRVYLSGAIEYAPDYGRKWRSTITPFLRSFGHSVYDPALDEKKNLTDHEVENFRAWKSSDLPRFQQTIRKIIAYDLDWIENRTDYIICYWDEHCSKGAGTQAELTLAHRLGIPVYLVAAMPVVQISGWVLGCSAQVFSDFDHLQLFLNQQFAGAGGTSSQTAGH